MIADASALLAIALNEPDAAAMAEAIPRAPRARNLFRSRFDKIVDSLRIEIVPFTADHARLARQAWCLFGKWKHAAQLNYGDCMAYAVAKAEGSPLLFKGSDFGLTDIEPGLRA